jgi:protein-disulfide isomerase
MDGTPTLVFEDGSRVPGALDVAQVQRRLVAAAGGAAPPPVR